MNELFRCGHELLDGFSTVSCFFLRAAYRCGSFSIVVCLLFRGAKAFREINNRYSRVPMMTMTKFISIV